MLTASNIKTIQAEHLICPDNVKGFRVLRPLSIEKRPRGARLRHSVLIFGDGVCAASKPCRCEKLPKNVLASPLCILVLEFMTFAPQPIVYRASGFEPGGLEAGLLEGTEFRICLG